MVRKIKVHEYWGIDLDYTKQVIVKLSMINYLNIVIQEFSDHLGKTTATPKYDHLFTVRNEGETQYLPEEQAHTFHHILSQLLSISVSSLQDIQTTVAFLATRVNNTDKYDW